VFDALLLLVANPGGIDVPSEVSSPRTHAVLLLGLGLLTAAMVMVWKHGCC
jgi:hypothetical protein